MIQSTTNEHNRLRQQQTTLVCMGKAQFTVEPEARALLQALLLNAISTSNTPIQRKRGQPKKHNRLRIHQKRHNLQLDIKKQEITKAKAELQKRDDNA